MALATGDLAPTHASPYTEADRMVSEASLRAEHPSLEELPVPAFHRAAERRREPSPPKEPAVVDAG